MVKLTKRKGFNFFRSYFDVYNELESDADKVAFIDALLDRQFMGIKPTGLKGMGKFAYISQTNSIDSQVKGYEDKMKIRLDGRAYYKDDTIPINGGTEPPAHGVNKNKINPTVQVEEKEKEKEKEQQQYVSKNIIDNINFLNETLNSEQWMEVSAMNNQVSKEVISVFLSNFNDHLITMEEQKKSTKEFKSHFINWLGKQDLSPHRRKVIGKTNQ